MYLKLFNNYIISLGLVLAHRKFCVAINSMGCTVNQTKNLRIRLNSYSFIKVFQAVTRKQKWAFYHDWTKIGL